ncbi:uncharacterized protein FIBRA_00017 [Fibroporia radiculosa]|uniref:Homeobox domain-containing protein n=1 Tax=Fibroporia radiculosa TaxID=599839 RepID=J7S5H8_9APHY|nr:uncharacterized protein FIBRA_00017 [Fibroporia radiculosa]CCL98024.1 predicted protein [Fibroporia radiculosa]
MNNTPPGTSSSGNPSDDFKRSHIHRPSSRYTLFSHSTLHDPQEAVLADHYQAPSESRPSQEEASPRRRDTMEEERREHAERSSPSISSSQGDMADTEMEAGPSQSSDAQAQLMTSPPKKKRTRTLTTPHQSAVLHALLAQSRFPTTAMREEVGRAIGLSARKVQNQRQKARRPRGQATAPLTRPPQFGAFSNAPPGPSSEVSIPLGSAQGSSASAHAHGGPPPSLSELASQHEAHATQSYPGSVSGSQLSGPGIPGPSSAIRAHPTLPREARDSTASQERLASSMSFLPMGPTSLRPSRPLAADEAAAEGYRAQAGHPPRSRLLSDDLGAQQPDFPITLAPILMEDNLRPPNIGPHHAASPRFAASPTPDLSMGDPHRLPQASYLSEPTFVQRPLLNIPPPFTLQPRPQWDDLAFSPFSRPRTSPQSRTSNPFHAVPGDAPFLPPVESPTPRPWTSFSQMPNRPRVPEGVSDPTLSPTAPSSRTRSARPGPSFSQHILPSFTGPRTGSRPSDDAVNERFNVPP